jgi:preprotein translocase subunit SecD
MKLQTKFFFIVLLVIATVIISFPKNVPIKFNLFGKNIDIKLSSPEIHIRLGNSSFDRNLDIKKGLDLQGGTELVLRADMSNVADSDKQNALESAREVISRRVDLYGVSEPSILTSKVNEEYRIIVDLPGIESIDDAIALVGKTAQLDFRELPAELKESTESSVPLSGFIQTGLTGKDLQKAFVQFDGTTGQPVVAIQFSGEGKNKFGELTTRNVGKPVAIFLDEMPITAPQVNEAITTGEAVISGSFTTEEAKELAIQLNAGALPVPIEIIEQRTIGPSLGEESIQKSVFAGMIGLAAVMIFMVVIYGRLGLIADLALLIYGLVTLSLYKLIPITLTLPGIAGFILSVGMAVDSNILIFERMKEEIRTGKPWQTAMLLGFGKAWDSIKDANLTTILTALILLNPFNISWLVTSGTVRGFALTLLIGVLISMFTGVFVSRVLLRTLYKGKDSTI